MQCDYIDYVVQFQDNVAIIEKAEAVVEGPFVWDSIPKYIYDIDDLPPMERIYIPMWASNNHSDGKQWVHWYNSNENRWSGCNRAMLVGEGR